MSDNWDFYFCKVEDQPASIFLDLGIREAVPVVNLSHLVWLRLYMNSPREDGLSSQEEFENLREIEDAIEAKTMASERPIQYVGRCTTNGARDFYFYASEGPASEQAIDAALASFTTYKFETGSRIDAEWQAFLGFLYPSERILQTIENRQVLETLKEHGDRHEIVRGVFHWIYFPSAKDRDEFAAATEKGYREKGRDDDGSAPRSFKIEVVKENDVQLATINDTTLELFDIAQKVGGEYDGWETSVEQ